ncbi:MAG: ABC transporter permease subunit [candidate division KSB1 bacterium]|nr:ABC transporter permease subunit [candidate division KSB1 bacterium]
MPESHKAAGCWCISGRSKKACSVRGEVTENRYEIDYLGPAPTALVLESGGQAFFLGTENGQLYKYTLSEDGPARDGQYSASDTSITVLGFLIGERSLVVGDSAGRITVWFESFDEGQANVRTLKPVHRMQGHPSAVVRFTPSQRNRTFITTSLDGLWHMQYSTNERLLYTGHHFDAAPTLVRFAPKGDGALFLDQQRRLWHFDINNPHPEASLKAFFGKIWYEGYSKPDYVWQSSSGSDDFEPKLSLVPLIFGTLKGTFYALLFAFPIAILAAVYVSQFLYPRWKSPIKSVMEIMAALPSVIIGFIGGLWLAPRVQDVAPAIFTMFIVIPAGVILVSWLYSRFSGALPVQLENGFEAVLIIPVVLVLGWLCLQWNGAIEQVLFAGDFRQWLVDTLNLHYDQRNAFVVGLVMGFAVIPLIFTISEDALSNVPSSLSAASLALGATRWQTALFIVVPAATPGIFSATMIGLGRAIGETMIVLMATGNTPVMDWNIFNGFRTLSANIAVEIPEAPQGGTLYRTLFLSALLLFMMTFLVNTVAELVRMRMRKKYENL